MAVFVAASDESDGRDQTGPFLYGGYVAPVDYWTDIFAPAWEERVLNRRPVIKAFHMAEIRNEEWQVKNGLKPWEAYARIEEAVSVVASCGALHPVITMMNGGHFREAFQGFKVPIYEPQPGKYRLEPDFIGFEGFVFGVLEYIAERHSDAEKVDLLVERKTGVTNRLDEWMKSITLALEQKGYGRLVRYVGEVIPAGKDRVPLQAADLMLWLVRKYEAEEADADDVRRVKRLLDTRWQTISGPEPAEIQGVADRSRLLDVPDPFANRRKLKRADGERAS